MQRADVAVVGAGPAGMAAALAAAEAGAKVVLLDEYARPGGQFFKHAGEAFALDPTDLGREHAAGEELRRALGHPNIHLMPSTLVWGVFPDDVLMLYRGGRSQALHARALVLATGAYDRPVAFPGWTLPGVMSAGGAQTLAKTQWVKPGRRMLLAGAGPFLLPVAQQLLRVGVEIALLAEATQPPQWLPHAPALWGQWPRFVEAFDYWRSLRAARVPVRYGHKLVRVLGRDAVEAAVIARVDESWNAVPGTEQTIAIDAVATGYGFLPNIELAACCGCDLRFDPCARTWFVSVSSTMLTSRPNIFAAGEVTGIGGSALALAEGKIAGISAVELCGAITSDEAQRRRAEPMRRRARLARFADMLNVLFRPRPGLFEMIDDATTVCRCEEVAAGELRSAIRDGCASLKEAKDWTRAGMGLCQGRMCRATILELIAAGRGIDAADVPPPRIRPPIKPVPLSALVETEQAVA